MARPGPPDRAWQAELWRRLRERIGVPSPAERLDTAPARLADEPELLDLPDRLSLFGLTRLPASRLQVLGAIAVHRDVHLFLLHPSGVLWDKLQEAEPRPPAHLRREDDPTATLPANPLLRSWGRDSREMQLVLGSHGVAGGRHRHAPRGDPGRRPPRPDAGGTAGGEAEDLRPVLREDDDSLRVHSCHGRAREVEVVRDAVLHLLAADGTLEPRDV